MAERIVINTGPLITLARIDCLEIVGQLIEQAVEEGIRYHPDLVQAALEAVGEA